jgi:hypothetical protein
LVRRVTHQQMIGVDKKATGNDFNGVHVYSIALAFDRKASLNIFAVVEI